MEIRINSNVEQFIEAKEEALLRGLEMCGLKGEGYAKKICPVDTGNLRNSITHAMVGDKEVCIATNVEYAPYVELGTQKTKAQPYLKPAVADHLDVYKRILESELRNG